MSGMPGYALISLWVRTSFVSLTQCRCTPVLPIRCRNVNYSFEQEMLKSLIMILILRVIRASQWGCPINPVSELLDAVV